MNESAGRLLNGAPDLVTYLQYEERTIPPHIRDLFQDVVTITKEFLVYSIEEVKKRYRSQLSQQQFEWSGLIHFASNPATIVSRLSQEDQERLRKYFTGELQIQQGAVWLDSRQSIWTDDLPPDPSRRTGGSLSVRLADDPNLLFYLAVAKPALRLLLQFRDLWNESFLKPQALEPTSRTQNTRYPAHRPDAAWFEHVMEQYVSLGIDAQSFFAEVESASHFLTLPSDERRTLVNGFLNQLQVSVANQPVAERFRAMQLRAATQIYYQFADKTHNAVSRKQFLSQSTQMVLSGYFEGSWFKFLEYLHEQPAENDYISTHVPKPQVLIPLKPEIKTGDLPVAEVERILDSLDPSSSGLRARMALAHEYWDWHIDNYATQQPGTEKLGDIIDGDYEYYWIGWDSSIFQNLIPQTLMARIDALFGRQTSSEYPTARATALSPCTTFCRHFYPALLFWHRIKLSIRRTANGSISWTCPRLLDYYGKSITGNLSDLGCPIDDTLFKELEKFQDLNEVFLSHMRGWTEKHFETFWRERYKTRVTECGRRYNRMRESTGREPTISKFVNREVATVVNEYFGGNVFSLLEALGEPLPKVASLRDNHLIISLEQLRSILSGFASKELPELYRQLSIRNAFILMALRYCILWEARGTRPTKSASSSYFYFPDLLRALGFDPNLNPEKAWTDFCQLVERVAAPALLSDFTKLEISAA